MKPSPRPEPPEFPEGNGDVVSKGPCPKCDTEFGNVTYRDGHAYCFACKHSTVASGADGGGGKAAQAGRPVGEDSTGHLLSPTRDGAGSDPFQALVKRGLKSATLRRFGYFQAGFKGQTVHAAPYFSQADEVVRQKLRFPNKEFVAWPADGPNLNACRLFGHHVFGDKFDRKVVVTEGELDAMSVAQAMDFKFAAVSVNTGAAGAVKNIKTNYLWLDRFAEIIIWFDDDEPGQAAASEVAKLFAVGKVKIAKAPGFKDASDCLQAGKPGDIESAVWAATAWRPSGIVNASSHEEDVMAPKDDEALAWRYDWPWEKVQDFLGPIIGGQVVYHVAGTGVGKTTGISEIAYHLIEQGCKICLIGFEDSRRDQKLHLLNVHVSDRLDLNPRPDDEMVALHRDLFGKGLVELFDPESAEWDIEAVLGYIRYCAKALDCRVLFLDPLTVLAALLSAGDDERRALDKVSCDLALLSKELGVHIQVAHHLVEPSGDIGHEDGAATSIKQVRGSRGIANLANIVIGHERNQQAEGDLALVTQLRALKNRPRSRTGPMLNLIYDPRTGRLKPTKLAFPSPGNKRPKGGPPPFPTNSSDEY